MSLTIFTPTYNRAHTLPALYDSLRGQTSRNFDWLIVDDGSTDGTSDLVEGWIAAKKIPIRYIRQPNGGKHHAINRALKEPCGYLFLIVDSDDRLADAGVVERLLGQVAFLEAHPDFCAVVGNKVHPDGRTIGTQPHYDVLDTNFVEYRERHHISGDRAEVVKTAVMREFPFPEIEGEKFCGEAYIWCGMAQKYRARYLDTPLIECEYLAGGLSDSALRIACENPVGSMLGLSKYARHPDTGWFNSMRLTIHAWCYAHYSSEVPFREKVRIIGRPWLLPVGVLYRRLKIGRRR